MKLPKEASHFLPKTDKTPAKNVRIQQRKERPQNFPTENFHRSDIDRFSGESFPAFREKLIDIANAIA